MICKSHADGPDLIFTENVGNFTFFTPRRCAGTLRALFRKSKKQYIYIYARLTFLSPVPARGRRGENFFAKLGTVQENAGTALRRCRRWLRTIEKAMENNDLQKARGWSRSHLLQNKLGISIFSRRGGAPGRCAPISEKAKNSIYIYAILTFLSTVPARRRRGGDFDAKCGTFHEYAHEQYTRCA